MSGKRKTITYFVNERGCHICTSHAPGTHGYPGVYKDGRNQNLHRVLYEEANGPLLVGQLARHTCDDVLCINLDHIIPGTSADNTTDITERGRHNPPVGERSGTAKLILAEVEKIRRSLETQAVLAEQHNVNQSTISRIKTNKYWKII